MDIKEIALRISEKADEYADAKLQSKGEFHPDWHTVRDEYFAEAIIAELAKQNEPVALTNSAQLGYVTSGQHQDIPLAMWSRNTNYSGADIPLYALPPTAEQIANETAEAIAEYMQQSGIGGEFLAESIRSGEWKEFKK